MKTGSPIRWPVVFALGFVLTVALFHSSHLLKQCAIATRAISTGASILCGQAPWIIHSAIIAGSIVLIFVRVHGLRGSFLRWDKYDLGLVLLLSLIATGCVRENAGVSTRTDPLVFSYSIGLGLIFSAAASIAGSENRGLAKALAMTLASLLGIASVLQGDPSMQIQYFGGSRWSGPWQNPNCFGLLMAAGSLLTLGLAIAEHPTAGRARWEYWLLKSALAAR